MIRYVVLAGALGVASRVEEVTPGFSLAISSNATWLALAALSGTAVRGALALTVTNFAYYAWIVLTEDIALEAAAGPPLHWFALGVLGGCVCGSFATVLGRPLRAGAIVWVAVQAGDALGVFDVLLP